MIGVNLVDQQEWWVSDGYWYPPMQTHDAEFDLDTVYGEMGVVRVRSGRRRLSLWWDIDNVDQTSLDCVLDYLKKFPKRGESVGAESVHPAEIRIHAFKVGWVWESLATPEEAVTRIEAFRALRGVAILPQTHVSTRVPIEADSGESIIPLASALFGRRDWYEKLRRCALADHALFFGRAGLSGQLQFLQVGRFSECARVLGEAWRHQAVGTAADLAFADHRFDHRVSRSYQEALTAGQPIFEHIVGLIDVGDRRIWLPYQRLLLPDGDRLACFTTITRKLSIAHPMVPPR